MLSQDAFGRQHIRHGLPKISVVTAISIKESYKVLISSLHSLPEEVVRNVTPNGIFTTINIKLHVEFGWW